MKIKVNVKLGKKPKKKDKLTLLWVIGPISEQPLSGPPTRRNRNMLQLTNTQQATLSISAVDRKGKKAPIDSIVFTSSDENVATVTADPSDPSKALLKAVDSGTAQVNVTADADLGDGVNTLTGTLDIVVVAGQAVSLAIATGTPEEQPE